MRMIPTASSDRAALAAAAALLLAGAATAPLLGVLVALPAAAAAAAGALLITGPWAERALRRLRPRPGRPAASDRLTAPSRTADGTTVGRPAAHGTDRESAGSSVAGPLGPVVVAGAGVVSSVATVAVRLRGGHPVAAAGASSAALVEVGALLLLTVVAVRAGRWRAAVPAGVAVSCWFLRFGVLGPASLPAVGFWAAIALLAAAGGGYLRTLDQRRAEAVAAARRSQRLQLARDLHDFVAHDVSEMLALAQAGSFVTETGGPAAELFGRIEYAAQQALAAMDRTVHMLHEEPPTDGGRRRPLPTLADLPGLADRFAAAEGTAVRLDLDPRLAARLPREVSATAHRVAVESLTNIRRHAPGTGAVSLAVRRAGQTLEITVCNEPGGAAAPRERRGGLGLIQLTEQVEALGGTLTAGPLAAGGWRTAARLPLSG
ncbi:histidine kinase [Kitasatospora sp. NPDC002227]|uniref:sensor histidine kinase n=1 Tax=Kitasatospora sp. NPDC002227 TaxID=3154773 RepID=UPI003318A33A